MTNFRTLLPSSAAPIPICHQDKLMSIGSCFAENIGQQLADAKFQIVLNPFGIVYNPISVINSLSHIIENKVFTEKDLFFHQERWHSFAHHSRFSDVDKIACLERINATIHKAHIHLQDLDVLTLTFGTAHVFHHKKEEKIVNNCHQLPADTFERRLLSIDEITSQLASVLEHIKVLRPNLRVILTVSPVRHIRDGLVASKLAKSILLVAVHKLCDTFNHVSYFPAYELVVDDLRDYRFYNEDMIHPNNIALKYIFDHFLESYSNEDTTHLIKRIDKLKKAIEHRPFLPDSERHRKFLAQFFNQTCQLKKDYPFLNLEKELDHFSKGN